MKTYSIFSVCLLVLLSISACSSPLLSPTPTPTSTSSFTITDALGRQVSYQSPPQRIALAGKANLLVADALYLFPQAVNRVSILGKGAQGAGNFLALLDPAYDDKPRFENEVGAEQIAFANPDTVILKSYLTESLGKPLETLGIPVIYVDFETPEQYFRDIQIIGQLFQDPARTEQIIAFYQSRLDRVRQPVAALAQEQMPRVLLLYYNDKDGSIAFNVPPMNWMQTILVQSAGGNPVWQHASLGNGWTVVSLEQIAAWDPDQVYIISYFKSVDLVTADLKNDPLWQSLRAVRQNQLFGFAGDLLSWDQADTRWILGLNWLATRMHPTLFPNLDMRQEAQLFFQEMYGLSEATFQQEISPLLTGDLP